MGKCFFTVNKCISYIQPWIAFLFKLKCFRIYFRIVTCFTFLIFQKNLDMKNNDIFTSQKVLFNLWPLFLQWIHALSFLGYIYFIRCSKNVNVVCGVIISVWLQEEMKMRLGRKKFIMLPDPSKHACTCCIGPWEKVPPFGQEAENMSQARVLKSFLGKNRAEWIVYQWLFQIILEELDCKGGFYYLVLSPGII